jgi:hypothetical protein
MTAKVATRYLTDRDYTCWNALVTASSHGSIYSTPEYLDVLCSECNATFRILVAERAGEIVGGIALFERASRWGQYVSGRLLLYYNGFVLKSHPSKYPSEQTARDNETISALAEELRQQKYGRFEVKNRGALTDVRAVLQQGWKAWPSYSYVVKIDDLETAWSRVEQNLRRLVGRCESEGICFTDDDDFDSFFRLHEQTHNRKGTTLYLPQKNFERYFKRLKSQGLCGLYHARTATGQAISSQLVLLGHHTVSHTVSAAADAAFLKTGASAFLRWRAFEHMSKLGYSGNDLTDAQLNPVTHFKSQLGGNLEMNLVLSQPDRGAFVVERNFARATRLAKGVMRQVAVKLNRKAS